MTELAGNCEAIWQDPLEDEAAQDDLTVVIPLLKLQTTQGFFNALKVATLKTWACSKMSLTPSMIPVQAWI